MRYRVVLKTLLAAVVVTAVMPVATASAGRLLVTGHDADFHCDGGEQCHFVEVATSYVRGGAPDPSKPVLVLDRGDNDFDGALNNAFPGGIPRVLMDPRGAQFASESLTTDKYSAILIASDINCGGCDLNEFGSGAGTPDSDAIAARKSDIEAFFNAGGGVYANSGATHGNGNPGDGSDTYYSFIPLPIGGAPVAPPFCLTPEGAALGFEDPGGCPDASKRRGTRDDINCCETHNSFAEPEPDTAIQVAERASDNKPETLFADGIISGGRIVRRPPATTPGAAVPADCSRRVITLVDARVRGSRVTLSGVVHPQLAGRRINVLANSAGTRKSAYTRLARATANALGEFRVRVRRPRGRRNLIKARYRAQIGRFRSATLKLPQSLATRSVRVSGNVVELRGRVKRSLLGRRNPVTIKRLVCGRYRTVARVRPDRRGNYVARFTVPLENVVAYFRAESMVLNKPGGTYVKQYARGRSARITPRTG